MGAASSLVIGQSSIAPVSPFGSANSDYDTLTNAEEITVGTNPALTDTDGDFITDSDELSITLTNPLLADSNGDGLSDYVNWVTAHPQLWDVNRNALWDARDLQFNDYSSYQGFWWATAHLIDTDGDGISDRDEFWYGNWFKYKYWHNDSDGDGILDGVEWNGPDHWLPTDYDHDGLAASSEYNTDPNNPDSDGDGLPDGVDSFFRTQAHVDSDNDGLNDLEELLNGSCPAHGDYDEDWLDDSQERILGSNPYAYDTDMDGLSDGYEFFGTLFVGPTDPLFIDSDGDFLTDFEEQWSWYTTTASYFNGNLLDPNNPDTDGDGVLDYFEVNLTDTDNGGVPDVMERYYGLNPLLSSDDIGDLDNDGETNVVEYQNGTLLDGNYGPRYDWDRDGMTNVWEIAQGLDPTDPLDAYDDPDGDYLFNIEEYQARTNPHLVLTPGAQLIVILTLDPTTFSVVHIPARTDYEAAMRSALPAGLVRGNGPDAQREHEDDWDGDGLTNRSEMLDDPFTSPRTPTADADGDSLPSAWEISMTLNPLNGDQNTSGTNDRDDDFDQDTLTNHAELLAGTHPLNSDTDADGLPDGWEISFGLNPLDASGDHGSAGDPDGDGYGNLAEYTAGSQPNNRNNYPGTRPRAGTAAGGFWRGMPQQPDLKMRYWRMSGNTDTDVPDMIYATVNPPHGESSSTTFPVDEGTEEQAKIDSRTWVKDIMDSTFFGPNAGPPQSQIDANRDYWASFYFPGHMQTGRLVDAIASAEISGAYSEIRNVAMQLKPAERVGYQVRRNFLVFKATEEENSEECIGHVTFTLPKWESTADITLSAGLRDHGVQTTDDVLYLRPHYPTPDEDPLIGTKNVLYLVAVDVLQTKLADDRVSTQGLPAKSDYLRFSRCREAFQENGDIIPNFIASDRDRVIIRVPKHALDSTNGPPEIKVRLGGPASDETTLTMEETFLPEDTSQQAPFWSSRPFLLMADPQDDAAYNGQSSDNALNDPTLQADFNSEMTIELTPKGSGDELSLPTAKVMDHKGLIMTRIIMAGASNSLSPSDDAQLRAHHAKAAYIYKQLGISVSVTETGGLQLPETFMAAVTADTLAPEMMTVMRPQWLTLEDYLAQNTAGGNVHTIFVFNVNDFNPDQLGFSYEPSNWLAVAVRNESGNENRNDQVGVTFAHELGHALGLQHIIKLRHLMHLNFIRDVEDKFRLPKRFTDQDEATIYQLLQSN